MIAEARRPRCELFWNNGAMNTVRDDRRHHFHAPCSTEFTTQLAGQRFWESSTMVEAARSAMSLIDWKSVPAMCGQRMTFGSPSRGLSGSGGSLLMTSRPAPASWPEFRASRRSTLDDQAPAGGVDQVGAFFHLREKLAVDHAAGGVHEWQMQADGVGASEQLLERHALDAVARSKSASTSVSKATTRTWNAGARMRDGAADAAHSDEPECHPPYGPDQSAVPATAVNHAVVVNDPPGQGQEECPGLLGDAVLVCAWCNRDGNFVLGGGVDVDQVIANAGASDHAQLRGEREKVGRHALSTGNQGVDIAQMRKKLLSRQGEVALWIDQIETTVREDLPKMAGLIAKKIGADQNSGHGHLGVSEGMIAGNACPRRTTPPISFSGEPPPPCVGQSPNLFSSKPDGNLVSAAPFSVRPSRAARERRVSAGYFARA